MFESKQDIQSGFNIRKGDLIKFAEQREANWNRINAPKCILKEIYLPMILVDDNIEGLLDQMHNYNAPHVEKWITTENT